MSDLRIGKYRHFKGGEYEVIAIAKDCEDPEKEVVVYRALYDSEDFEIGQVWTRLLEDFIGFKNVDGEQVKRFTFIEE
ncbi:MAG: DUF1653 domain-containing protein [Nanoarchaeota archaeon]|nr:DUF1653 domain-containing protein [Nanoarchaeota archaeon]